MPVPRKRCLSYFPPLAWLFLILASGSALAQKPAGLVEKLTEIDFVGGYSYLRVDSPTFGFSDYSGLNGWTASVTLPHIYEQLGFTVNASGNYGTGLKVYNFLLGPQLAFELGKVRVYGNVLFGKAETKITVQEFSRNEAASVGRSIAFGGGAEIGITRHIAVRLIDADYVDAKTFGAKQSNVRISTGLVYRFGGK